MKNSFVPIKLAEYQFGAVVSKEVSKSAGGSVTVFAFDKGEGLSEHTAPFDALAFILDGEAFIKVSGKGNVVKKGEMLFMPANKPHSLKARKRFKMLLVMLRK